LQPRRPLLWRRVLGAVVCAHYLIATVSSAIQVKSARTTRRLASTCYIRGGEEKWPRNPLKTTAHTKERPPETCEMASILGWLLRRRRVSDFLLTGCWSAFSAGSRRCGFLNRPRPRPSYSSSKSEGRARGRRRGRSAARLVGLRPRLARSRLAEAFLIPGWGETFNHEGTERPFAIQ
jgi:hypothetical protein